MSFAPVNGINLEVIYDVSFAMQEGRQIGFIEWQLINAIRRDGSQ
jgi:hypothetical protein